MHSSASSQGKQPAGCFADLGWGGTVADSPDDRSQIARAYQWATRIMVVSLEMVLPGVAGSWLDSHLGTVILFTLVGFGFGTTAAVVHLIQMTRADGDRDSK
jgi:hypothetical protein